MDAHLFDAPHEVLCRVRQLRENVARKTDIVHRRDVVEAHRTVGDALHLLRGDAERLSCAFQRRLL